MATAVSSCFILFLAFTATHAHNRRAKNEAFIERLNNGMKIAKDYFGMESAAMKAADFVLRAFQPREPARSSSGGPGVGSPGAGSPGDEQHDTQAHPPEPPAPHDGPFGSLRSVVKLLGLEPTQIGAVAVNAIIFVAQMISTFLAGGRGKQRGRAVRSGDPAAWILARDSPQLQRLLTLARNDSLPSILQDVARTREDTSCVRLLVCKAAPFVSGMQAAVFGAGGGAGAGAGGDGGGGGAAAALYRHLPARREVEERGAACERRYPECDLNK